ncbi:hypothetical protein KCU65_g218, partial [Aureobasidium melanogenum]
LFGLLFGVVVWHQVEESAWLTLDSKDCCGRTISGRAVAGAGCFDARIAFGCVGGGWTAFLGSFDGNTGCDFWTDFDFIVTVRRNEAGGGLSSSLLRSTVTRPRRDIVTVAAVVEIAPHRRGREDICRLAPLNKNNSSIHVRYLRTSVSFTIAGLKHHQGWISILALASHQPVSCHKRTLPILLLSESIVSCVVLPFSFSSRLMRTTAADAPMNKANTGSRFLSDPISHPVCVVHPWRDTTDLEMIFVLARLVDAVVALVELDSEVLQAAAPLASGTARLSSDDDALGHEAGDKPR